ncbi:MAG: ThiF family adenylyltransferase, partial [Oscillospiraceae bacterium]
MEFWYDRTQKLIGQENYKKIQNSCVAVVGLGGVGGSIAEALCRSGVGKLIIMDFDNIDITNINR